MRNDRTREKAEMPYKETHVSIRARRHTRGDTYANRNLYTWKRANEGEHTREKLSSLLRAIVKKRALLLRARLFFSETEHRRVPSKLSILTFLGFRVMLDRTSLSNE